jgi:hypothetical protein
VVTVVGRMDALRLAESGKTARSTGELNPRIGEIVIVAVVGVPAPNDIVAGLDESAKSGPITVTGMKMECARPPLVPFTSTEYRSPGTVPVEAVTESVEVVLLVMDAWLRTAVIPGSEVDGTSETVPVKPNSAVMLMVDIDAPLPAVIVSWEGFADNSKSGPITRTDTEVRWNTAGEALVPLISTE